MLQEAAEVRRRESAAQVPADAGGTGGERAPRV